MEAEQEEEEEEVVVAEVELLALSMDVMAAMPVPLIAYPNQLECHPENYLKMMTSPHR